MYDPPPGTGSATLVAEKDIVDGGGNSVELSSMDWDSGRGLMWGVSGDVWRMDFSDPTDPTEDVVVTSEFTHSGPSFIDGFAFDGSDDTFWVSGDVDQTIFHHALDGTQIGTVQPKNSNGDNVGVSGVAIGADINGRPTLYIGKHGPEKILRVFADDGTFISDFAVEVGFRIEDLACDPNTYAPKESLITKSAFEGRYKAFEVEPGTCLLSGTVEEEEEECINRRNLSRGQEDRECPVDEEIERGGSRRGLDRRSGRAGDDIHRDSDTSRRDRGRRR